MRKIIFTAFSLLFGQTLIAQNYSGAESVEFDYANNRYLVSNTISKKIIARAANGTLSVFATCATAPYGIEIFGDTLYCCTSGSITGIQLATGSIIFNKPITGSQFINGITHDPSGNLYITDFYANKVYKFNTANRQFSTFVSNTLTQPNGITYDAYDGINPRLVMVSWGGSAAIRAIDIASATMTTLATTPFSNNDGIAKGKNGNFYISCWSNNSIQRYDSTFANAPTAMVTGLSSDPADIFYNQLSDTLAVPIGSNVNFYYFGTLTSLKSNLNVDEINVFPNPSDGIIQISGLNTTLKDVSLNLFEIGTGKQVFNQNIGHLNLNELINLKSHQLSAGIYLLELNSNDGIVSRKKLIIE